MTTWISQAAAAEIVGCNATTIEHAVAVGRIAHRPRRGPRPSLDRASVEAFAKTWQAEQARRAERRAARPARDPEPTGPPPTDDVWLDSPTTAALLGWTPTYVARLADHDRLPGIRHGRRWWFRRADVERYAAARAFALRFKTA
ncbi:helix-turn-helix domain-containing protein [Nocardioides sp. MAH-18]|uniref:Helix-turn-helix domain-containing protein n=1 Tax=Nocardioides agri TaxID=2682843 RepID=A0A6L6XMY7_9ACTN|nr:helix-turn-helix domain-containing protein [Nocardioides sp. CGMCC 1.13656]MBA2953440.1 helix-turn-helix domain-containing protein [Nocardioides sp. CGMCC 1.13656]MVQ48308.1 helix-turn-helix domain-containing protein [Nocardioides sp. MAH-18]